MNLFDAVIEWGLQSKIAFAERLIPPYVSSLGCHYFNLENQKREFYLEHGRVANTRMHIFFCAPPGYTKSLILQRLIMGGMSAFADTEVKVGFEGSMTEAAFTGTLRVIEQEIQTVFGAAHEHRESILGIDEFAALTNAMKMEHSINLDNAMLTALDSGYLIKRLAMGKIQYMTQLTLWTGSQPARFDLTSGLGRRFFFIYFVPSLKEEDIIRRFRRKAKNTMPKNTMRDIIRRNVSQLVKDVKRIKHVDFDDKIYRILDRFKIPHFEEPLYERLALGYNLATRDVSSKLMVEVDAKLEGMFANENAWRIEIKKGAEISEVVSVIKEMGYAPMTEVIKKLADFGVPYSRASMLIDIVVKTGQAKIISDTKKKGRPTRYVMATVD